MKISKILIGIFMPTLISSKVFAGTDNITHSRDQKLDLELFQKRLEQSSSYTLPLSEEKIILNQLVEFDLGRFLLLNKGLDGYHIAYAILYGPKKQNLSELEHWMLFKAPVILATRERFGIFQVQLQKRVKNGMKIASVPCGIMDDLLMLNYSKLKDVKIIGIDIDENSLKLAQENANKRGIKNVSFLQENAWKMSAENEYDLITSNGLNIYQHDDDEVVELYKQFNKALKHKGILITSFLTPPPSISSESTWKNYNKADAIKQKAIFSDIIGTQWQAYRTERLTRQQLEEAGFVVENVIYDKQGMFPTVIAKKK